MIEANNSPLNQAQEVDTGADSRSGQLEQANFSGSQRGLIAAMQSGNRIQLTVKSVTILEPTTGKEREIKNLDAETMETLAIAEKKISAELLYGDLQAAVHVGRNKFDILPYEQARRLQIERILDERSEAKSRSVEPVLSEDAVVFTGSSGNRLGNRVTALLGTQNGSLVLDRFANSESRIEVLESVRDRSAYIIMPMTAPVNEAVMETAFLVQAMALADARRITVVLPYFAYSRQDRKADTRPPISAKAFASILKSMGADHIVSVDLHARQVEGFFDGPFDNLEGLHQLVLPITKQEGSGLVVVSPDAGGSKRAQKFAEKVQEHTGEFAPLVVMSKFRQGPGVDPIVTFTVGGDFLKGKTCVLVDDMIDTGGSIIAAAKALKEQGAERVIVAASHGIFSNGAVKRMREATISDGDNSRPVVDKLFVTDSLPQVEPRSSFFQVVSIAPLIAEAIRRLDEPRGTLGPLQSRIDLGNTLPVY
jgi:ribose-phosphate pyrophosphokinase